MSFCTYCVWKHPGTTRGSFSRQGLATAQGNPEANLRQYCVLWPSAKLSPCLASSCLAKERHG